MSATPLSPDVLLGGAALTSATVHAVIARFHSAREWLLWTEVAMTTGARNSGFVDAFVIHQWPTGTYRRVAYEIKVSRADFLREIKAPMKRRPGLCWSNEFYFVTPPGLVRPDEVPPECGLREVVPQMVYGGPGKPYRVGSELTLETIIHAPWRDTPPPPWGLLVSLARSYERRTDEPKLR